jgi:hypothetical protein
MLSLPGRVYDRMELEWYAKFDRVVSAARADGAKTLSRIAKVLSERRYQSHLSSSWKTQMAETELKRLEEIKTSGHPLVARYFDIANRKPPTPLRLSHVAPAD